jgi:hypothetical protein
LRELFLFFVLGRDADALTEDSDEVTGGDCTETQQRSEELPLAIE